MNSNQPTRTIQWIKNNWIYGLFALSVAFFVYKQWLAPKQSGEWLPIKYTTYHTPLGWGYDVLVNDSIFIHQEQMPAVEGKRAFTSEADAAKVANLIVQRIKNRQLPTVYLRDLDSLQIAR